MEAKGAFGKHIRWEKQSVEAILSPSTQAGARWPTWTQATPERTSKGRNSAACGVSRVAGRGGGVHAPHCTQSNHTNMSSPLALQKPSHWNGNKGHVTKQQKNTHREVELYWWSNWKRNWQNTLKKKSKNWDNSWSQRGRKKWDLCLKSHVKINSRGWGLGLALSDVN